MKLEDLRPQATVRGILPDRTVTVVNVQWFSTDALELPYKDPTGRVANVLLYQDDEPRLELIEHNWPGERSSVLEYGPLLQVGGRHVCAHPAMG